jgi:hypothetical protein
MLGVAQNAQASLITGVTISGTSSSVVLPVASDATTTTNGSVRLAGDLGGTGQALRIAKHYDIPTFNLLNMTKADIFKEIKKLHLLY